VDTERQLTDYLTEQSNVATERQLTDYLIEQPNVATEQQLTDYTTQLPLREAIGHIRTLSVKYEHHLIFKKSQTHRRHNSSPLYQPITNLEGHDRCLF
jgi:hypothetical protein